MLVVLHEEPIRITVFAAIPMTVVRRVMADCVNRLETIVEISDEEI